jgi:hypothetical protein
MKLGLGTYTYDGIHGRMAACRQGATQHSATLRNCGAAGASPNATLELWPPEQKTLEETIALKRQWAAESIAYLRGYIRG